MSVYLVSDTDLTSIANAIRTKGSTNASLTFPTGFVSAIDDISTGGDGGVNFKTFIEGNLSEINDSTITTIKPYGFAHCINLSSINLPNCENIGS